MRSLTASWQFNLLLALLTMALLGTAGWVFARRPSAATAPPALPERLEWQGVPHSGAASLLLHGLNGTPNGALLPLPIRGPLLPPGLPEVWSELSAVLSGAPLPEQRDGFDGMQLFSGEQPPGSVPAVVRQIPGTPLNAAVRGQQLWLACNHSGLSILDLSDIAKPRLRLEWPADWVSQAAFAGNLAFLMNSQGRLEIVELAVSGRERLVFRQPLYQSNVEFLGLTVHQERLLLLKKNSKTRQLILSFCRLEQGSRRQLKFTDVPLGIASASGCWWREDRLYIADGRGKLTGMEVGNPLRPHTFLTTVLPAKIENLVCTGRTCLVRLVDGRVYALAVSPAGGPQALARNLGQMHGGLPVWLVFAGGRLLAFSPQRGIEVFRSLPIIPSSGPTALPGNPEKIWPDDVLQAVSIPAGAVILEEGGRVKLIGSTEVHQPAIAAIETGAASRWIVHHDSRIYVGGGPKVTILRADATGQLTRVGETPVPAGESFDAVVFDGILCVAAGRQGLVSLSLADPDRPMVRPVRQFPARLRQRPDVRSVAVHGRHLFLAGGRAGILKMTIDRDRQFTLAGIRPAADPVDAVVATGSLLLAATKTGIDVLAMAPEEPAGDLQFLGTLPIRNAQRLVVLDLEQLGARQIVGGWQVLPLPLLLPLHAGKPPRLVLPEVIKPGDYRLLLYSRDGVTEWPGVFSVAARASAGESKN